MESQKLLDCTCLGPLQVVKDWESNHFQICRNWMELDPHRYEMIKTMKGGFPSRRDFLKIFSVGPKKPAWHRAWRIHGVVWNTTPRSTRKQILAIIIRCHLFPSYSFYFLLMLSKSLYCNYFDCLCVVSRPLGSFFNLRYPSLQLCFSRFICSVRPCCLRLLQVHRKN